MDMVDQEYLDELLSSQVSNGRPAKGDVKVTASTITWEELQKSVNNLGKGDRILDMNITLQLLQVGVI